MRPAIASHGKTCIVGTMNAAPDLDALARRYVELWQDHLAATAADPEISDALARMIAAGGGSMQAMNTVFQNLWVAAAGWPLHPGPKGSWSDAQSKESKDGVNNTAGPSRTETTGTASAAGSSRHGEHDVAELKARLALLEERLATLASNRVGKSRRPRKRARRHPFS